MSGGACGLGYPGERASLHAQRGDSGWGNEARASGFSRRAHAYDRACNTRQNLQQDAQRSAAAESARRSSPGSV